MKYLKKYEFYSDTEVKTDTEKKFIDFRQLSHRRKRNTTKRFKKAMKPMTLEESVDYVIENCSEWIENPVKITRSIDSDEEYFYSVPVRRFSTDNSNDYTLLMDNLPAWKEYPKRRKSFICTLGESHMNANSKYNIIPLNGSKWGVAPEFDIFHCFKKMTGKYINQEGGIAIDSFFNSIRNACVDYGFNLTDSNYSEYRKQIREFNKIITNDKNNELKVDYYFKNIMKHEDAHKPNFLWKVIVDVVNPKNNGFKLLSIPEIYKNMDELKVGSKMTPDNKLETWTDSPCIFIQNKKFFQLLEEKTGKKIKMR